MKLNAAIFCWIFFMGVTVICEMNGWSDWGQVFRYITLIHLVFVLILWYQRKGSN